MARNWYTAEGKIDTAALDEIEAMLQAVTDNTGGLMDRVSGKGMLPVFRCSHSGLHLPADYVKEWGRKYGIGLGPDPKSEVLDTDYHTPPPPITSEIRRIEQIMHPVRVSGAQVDLLLVYPSEVNPAIIAKDDPNMEERAKIVRDKQMKNELSQLPQMYMAWDRARKGN